MCVCVCVCVCVWVGVRLCVCGCLGVCDGGMSSAAVFCHSTIRTSIVTLTQGMYMYSPCTWVSLTHTYMYII